MTVIDDPTVHHIPLNHLTPAADNPRTDLGDIEGLRQSIDENGVIEPLIVTPVPSDSGELEYMIVAGHRRYAALCEGEYETAPCIVRELTEVQRMAVMTVENLQRADLSPLDEARAFQALADLGESQRTIADRVGVSQAHVSRRLKLYRLPDDARQLLADGRLSIRQAETLADLPDGDLTAVLHEVAGVGQGAQPLPDWAITAAIERRAKQHKHAEAVADGLNSGLTRLDRQPYKGAGEFEPCPKGKATHWYLANGHTGIIWAKEAVRVKHVTASPGITSTSDTLITPAEYQAARDARRALLAELLNDEDNIADLRRHGLAALADELLTETWSVDIPTSELRKLIGDDTWIADLSDDPGLVIACFYLAADADLDLDNDDDTTNAARARWVALGYELQPWEQAEADTDGIDATARTDGETVWHEDPLFDSAEGAA